MKALNNAGIKELVYLEKYERIQTGGEKFEEEDESIELANRRGIIIRKYEGNVYYDGQVKSPTLEANEHQCCGNC